MRWIRWRKTTWSPFQRPQRRSLNDVLYSLLFLLLLLLLLLLLMCHLRSDCTSCIDNEICIDATDELEIGFDIGGTAFIDSDSAFTFGAQQVLV
jgi:hypothetical protein